MLGCGEWHAYVATRGGHSLLYEIPWGTISGGRVMNDMSNCTIRIPGTNIAKANNLCCEMFSVTEPFEHEVLLYRNGDVVWAGPVLEVHSGPESGTITARDLFQWFERREFLEGTNFNDDAAKVFGHAARMALEQDPSPNIAVSAYPVGVEVLRRVTKPTERCADIMRELSRTALDFTLIQRHLHAGDLDTLFDTWKLHDQGVRTASNTKNGAALTTHAYITGTSESNESLVGDFRSDAYSERYGLVQQSFSEPLIRDKESAQVSARNRVLTSLPLPRAITASLSPDADVEFNKIYPGGLVDGRLEEKIGCIPLMEVVRLLSVGFSVNSTEKGVSESVDLQMIPLGEVE